MDIYFFILSTCQTENVLLHFVRMSVQTLRVLKGKLLDSRVPFHRHSPHFDALYLNVWHHSLALTVEKGKLSCLTYSVQVQWPWMLHPTPTSSSAPPIKWLMSGEFKECWFKDSIGSHFTIQPVKNPLTPFQSWFSGSDGPETRRRSRFRDSEIFSGLKPGV